MCSQIRLHIFLLQEFGAIVPPIIGITAGKILNNSQIMRVSLIDKYVHAIQMAGGVPLIIPSGITSAELAHCKQVFDGYLLTGGGDIDHEIFNGIPNSKISDVDSDRDRMEIELTQFAFESKKPILGICRGIQIMNVALGGSLFTDISTQRENSLKHDWYPNIARNYEAHTITIVEESNLKSIMNGIEVNVNSLHHQAIKDLGDQLSAIAFAPDGIVEAIESPKHQFFLGVQWHPEWMLSSPSMVNLFKQFIYSSII